MHHQHFQAEVKRLQDQWRAAYGEERVKVFWRRYGQVAESVFTEAVDSCLANCAHAPLAEDLDREIQRSESRSRERERESRSGSGLGRADFVGVAEDAAKKSELSKELVAGGLKLLARKVRGEFSPEQWDQAMTMLSQAEAAMNPRRCQCSGGWLWAMKDGYEWIYRCTCSAGKANGVTLYFPSDKERKWPYVVPLLPTQMDVKQSGRDMAANQGEEK